MKYAEYTYAELIICKTSQHWRVAVMLRKMRFENLSTIRSSPSEVLLGKDVLKIYSKFTGEHPCRSVISIKLNSHVGMGLFLKIYYIFSEHRFLITPIEGCF